MSQAVATAFQTREALSRGVTRLTFTFHCDMSVRRYRCVVQHEQRRMHVDIVLLKKTIFSHLRFLSILRIVLLATSDVSKSAICTLFNSFACIVHCEYLYSFMKINGMMPRYSNYALIFHCELSATVV